MSNYSSYSFNDIQLQYQHTNKENYLLHEGKSSQNIAFNASSYKKQKNNQTIWGSASYLNNQLKEVQWNNTLDLERIGPLVMADSVGGKTNVQTYQFTGGYNKVLNKFTWGASIAYNAALSYKTKDPRPKNVTSDLHFKLGGNYLLGSNYKLGLSAGINRYIQTSSISFSSETQKAALYQMNGLGNYNFYFSTRSDESVYVDFSHYYQLSLGSTDNSFALNAGVLKGKLSKETFLSANSSSYEINKINQSKYFLNALKTFNLSNEVKIGAKIDYHSAEKIGTEIFYTNNTDIIQKLLEKDNYQFKNTQFTSHLLFQYNKPTFNLSISPYFSTKNIEEKRLDNGTFHTFNYQYIGAQIAYIQQLNTNNILSLQTNVYQRSLGNYSKNYEAITKTAITNWLMSDYQVLSASYLAVETDIRYDVKMNAKTSLYAIFAYNLHNFSDNKNNTQTALTVGVAF